MNPTPTPLTLPDGVQIHPLGAGTTPRRRGLDGPLAAELTAALAASPRGEVAVRSADLSVPLLERNDILAERNRGYFLGRGLTALNLVSSPGAGYSTAAVARVTVCVGCQPHEASSAGRPSSCAI